MAHVIRMLKDVDFDLMTTSPEKKNVNITFETCHGTVIYVDEIIKGDDDAVMCFGAKDGEEEYKIAATADFTEFKRGWYKLIGRMDLVREIEEIENRARKVVENDV